MASKTISVMISSRCNDPIRSRKGGSVLLSDVRLRIQQKIEASQIFDRVSFECWVHEHEPALSGIADFWDQCLAHVALCDILIVLYNGNAGFANDTGDVGICHAELMRARRSSPGKVRIIDVLRDASVEPPVLFDNAAAARNNRFAEYLGTQQSGKRFAKDDEDAIDLICEALQDAVVDLVRLGGRETRRGGYYEGEPLEWSRLDYVARKATMETVLRQHLAPELKSPRSSQKKQPIVRTIDEHRILFCCHAVPSAMSTASAREMVGRPFLKDHEHVAEMEKAHASGPFHLIACHKGVTEAQALNLLGFPDATVVNPPFGIYVADPIQNIQLAFLAGCRDESSTRYAVQRFNEWLYSAGEAEYLARRAQRRLAIAKTIAAQQQGELTRGAAGG